jgi:hypothetical protein
MVNMTASRSIPPPILAIYGVMSRLSFGPGPTAQKLSLRTPLPPGVML